MAKELRIGQGIDIHRLVDGRALILGGVKIPFSKGLLGYSDADVIIHSIVDGMFGAAGKGDIGSFFPDTDPAWKDANSLELLARANAEISQDGWRIINLDVTLLAEAPKISPFVAKMKEAISQVLKIETSACGIKATTAERLGFVGREEGMLAQSVVLLERGS